MWFEEFDDLYSESWFTYYTFIFHIRNPIAYYQTLGHWDFDEDTSNDFTYWWVFTFAYTFIRRRGYSSVNLNNIN
jgi:hypothetical protein